MKHINLAAAIAATIALAVGAPAFAATSTGTSASESITFSGNVSADSCTVSIAGGSAKSDTIAQSATVTLPTVTSSAFGSSIATGAIAGATPFNVVLAGCPASVTSVIATWAAGTADANGNLKNSAGTGTVDVELLNGAGAQMNLSSPLTQPAVAVAAGGATLGYTAEYVSTAAASSFQAGSVQGTATLVLAYQ